jgi:FKBP-type peptidyl-prolyl cis-trans isomerase
MAEDLLLELTAKQNKFPEEMNLVFVVAEKNTRIATGNFNKCNSFPIFVIQLITKYIFLFNRDNNMKFKSLAAIAFFVVFCATNLFAQNQKEIKTRMDSIAYSIGVSIGKSIHDNLKQDSLLEKVPFLVAGLQDILAGKPTMIPEDKAQQVLMAFQTEITEKQKKALKEQGDKNEKEQEAFLAENKSKTGVITTESGLQYKVEKEGTGEKPTKDSKVKVHYKGTFIDGSTFDSSYDRNKPAEFPVSNVIKGWTEGLQLMSVGSKYQFWIPWSLAYGENGRPPQIGAKQMLIFEVELLEILPADAKPAAPDSGIQIQQTPPTKKPAKK